MKSMRRFRRVLSVMLVTLIVALCAGLLADPDENETAAESLVQPPALSVTALPDSIVNLLNEEYRAVEAIFRKSCFDCHSNSTDYPWYHSLPVIGSMMDDHIKEGREHLDFTDGFPFAGSDNQVELLGEIRGEIEEGKMPLLSYRLMHWGTLIEGPQKDSVFAWIDRTAARLQSVSRPE